MAANHQACASQGEAATRVAPMTAQTIPAPAPSGSGQRRRGTGPRSAMAGPTVTRREEEISWRNA